MKWTGLNRLREEYLAFFESKDHLRLKSFSLVPQGDKSLLLINSGMAPMKKYFTGEVKPPSKRVTTCQKCVRTPDIDQVGKTARHGTYFEMLGNFSFGDYFKEQACVWAWEFCTKTLAMPVEKLWISIYEEDDEAREIWVEKIGVSAEKIVKMGKKDNFWEHGAGPCGPCSELYFDRGEKYGCGASDCRVGCECDRYVEFWNNVFTQFNNDGTGNYTPLENPNIDTGMGLERLACIMQDVGSIFEVDTVKKIMDKICALCGKEYGKDEKTDISLRVTTDHIRSSSFIVADGVIPSNEGRGYVLRRLLRRAARHGKLLGIKGGFLAEVSEVVIAENKGAYPELFEKRDYIKKLIDNEEKAFNKTIDGGLELLEGMIKSLGGNTLSGADAFKLYDTYGFPLDLTKDILKERGFDVDEQAFNKLMVEQRERARNARKSADEQSWASEEIKLDAEPTEFVGYSDFAAKSEIKAIIADNKSADKAEQGANALIILDKTPFYAESGGQIGDVGTISGKDALFNVTDTVKNDSGVYLHKGTVIKGGFSKGQAVTAEFSTDTRRSTMRNHTAGHLLQQALRVVLGNHVEQAGQRVSPDRLRFDFTHFSALSAEELAKTEALVNDMIMEALPVVVEELTIAQAKEKGALALFGEKYGDVVRTVTVGDSVELCGGTHAPNTSNLGLFHITSEAGIASGVRRIEAITGRGVLDYLEVNKHIIEHMCGALKAGNAEELVSKVEGAVAEIKQKARELEELKAKLAGQEVESIISSARDVGAVKLVTAEVGGANGDMLRKMCDKVRDSAPNIVAVIAGVDKEKGSVTFASCCAKEAVGSGAHAGNIVREVAKIAGGSGGGRPDSAMAGGKDITKVAEALAAVEEIITKMISN